MGRFAQDFKGYEQLANSDCYMSAVPAGMTDALADVLAASCGEVGDATTVTTMKNVANDLLAMAGKKPTANWEGSALRAEIKAAFHILCEAKFEKFMDATLNAVQRLYKAFPTTKGDLLRRINDVLIPANFGYSIRAVDAAEHLSWEGRTTALAGVLALDEAADAVREISEASVEHLVQARAHLLNPTVSRSRKDAVRDAMSAVESMVKKLAGESEFAKASTKLREEKVWGNNDIVKEGYSTWSNLHVHHPDVRHGHDSGTDLDLEEALYWIDRMTTYVKYMAARKKALGR